MSIHALLYMPCCICLAVYVLMYMPCYVCLAVYALSCICLAVCCHCVMENIAFYFSDLLASNVTDILLA